MEIFHALKAALKKHGYSTASATKAASRQAANPTKKRFRSCSKRLRNAGYKPGEQVSIALDPASSEFYDKASGKYVFKKSDKSRALVRRDGRVLDELGRKNIRSSRSKTAWPKTIGRDGRS